MILEFDKNTGTWGGHNEPYATMDIMTEEDYEHLMDALDYWKAHHDEEGKEI